MSAAPATGSHRVRYVAGCMTGTSLDGLDVAVVKIAGRGLAMKAEVVASASQAFGPLASRLRALAEQRPMTAGAIAEIARDFALFHLRALRPLSRRFPLDLIALHGQTVHHAAPVSWQLMNPTPIANALSVPVVYDLRAADLAAGGQGAPITPLADFILYRKAGERRTVVNLGGFCNLTRLPASTSVRAIAGGDVCACNQILDAVARQRLGTAFDHGGRHALAGSPQSAAVASLMKLLAAQAGARRSLGTGDELGAWIGRQRTLSGPDLARSACAAIAGAIVAKAMPADRLILAGGGVRNRALVAEICTAAATGSGVVLSDDLGIPAQLRECAAMAVLGALCQDRVPITLPQVTGVAKAPVAGCWVLP